MILLSAVVIGLAATLLRARLTRRTLKLKQLRWEWLVFVSVIPQILLFQVPAVGKWVPESIVPTIQIVTMVGLVIFASANVTVPGFWALWIGIMSNFLVIISNGGWMPISTETLARIIPRNPGEFCGVGTRLGYTKDRIMAPAEINLAWLSDRLVLPHWLSLNIAFSVGDIFISIGTILLLWSLSNKEKEEE